MKDGEGKVSEVPATGPSPPTLSLELAITTRILTPMRKPQRKKSILGRLVLWMALTVIVTVLGAALYGYRWAQGYLKSDAFRLAVAAQLGRAARAEATLETLQWTGPNAYISKAGLLPLAGQAWKQIEGDGLQASLNLSAAWDGIWHVPLITVDIVRMNMRNPAEIPQQLSEALDDAPPATPVPAWLRGWIPARTQIDEVQIQSFDLLPPKDIPGVRATGIKITAKPGADAGAWLLRGEGGELALPALQAPFRITNTNARVDSRALVFNDALARWLGDSEVSARGDLPFEKGKAWSFTGRVGNLDLRHLLSPQWNAHLSGVLEGDYDVSAALMKAKVRVKSGIIQNLPVLNRVADFTRAERFRRVVLDTASADVERTGDTTKVTNLLLHSSGLIRVEGVFTIQGKSLDGNFLVGVSPETLRWLPGSQSHVFTETRSDAPGFVWTNVRLTGTIDSPREDLSNRLLLAAGKAIIEAPLEAAGAGVELLGKSGGAAADVAKGVTGTAVDVTKDVIKGTGNAAGKAVETGVDIIKGVVPIFGK